MPRGLPVMLLCAVPAFAQQDGRDTQFKDPLLENLIGRWEATGRPARRFRARRWHAERRVVGAVHFRIRQRPGPQAGDGNDADPNG